jgi:hypothetical protein
MRSDLDELTALALLAELDVCSGQSDRAVEILREPIARTRASTPRYDNGLAVRNYATALMESGHFGAAESAFRDALPLVRRAFGNGAFVLHDAAWLLARCGRMMTRPECPRMRKAYTAPWEGSCVLWLSAIRRGCVRTFARNELPKRSRT